MFANRIRTGCENATVKRSNYRGKEVPGINDRSNIEAYYRSVLQKCFWKKKLLLKLLESQAESDYTVHIPKLGVPTQEHMLEWHFFFLEFKDVLMLPGASGYFRAKLLFVALLLRFLCFQSSVGRNGSIFVGGSWMRELRNESDMQRGWWATQPTYSGIWSVRDLQFLGLQQSLFDRSSLVCCWIQKWC